MRAGLRTLLSSGGLGLLTDDQLEALSSATGQEWGRRKRAAEQKELEDLIGKELSDLGHGRREPGGSDDDERTPPVETMQPEPLPARPNDELPGDEVPSPGIGGRTAAPAASMAS